MSVVYSLIDIPYGYNSHVQMSISTIFVHISHEKISHHSTAHISLAFDEQISRACERFGVCGCGSMRTPCGVFNCCSISALCKLCAVRRALASAPCFGFVSVCNEVDAFGGAIRCTDSHIIAVWWCSCSVCNKTPYKIYWISIIFWYKYDMYGIYTSRAGRGVFVVYACRVYVYRKVHIRHILCV